MTSSASLAERVASVVGSEVRRLDRVGGGDICIAYRADTRDGALFVKTHPNPPTDLFAIEAAGLRWLAEPKALRVPEVLGVDNNFLALEWVDGGRHGSSTDEALGRGLAALHRSGADTFGPPPGAPHRGYLGDVAVDNSTTSTWSEFFVQRRLLPLVDEAIERGSVSPGARRDAERLASRAAEVFGPPEPPARLHGDLWGGNVMTGREGEPWLIDPAAHGGHREVDLAMLQLFGGFGERCFAAYDEESPLADGWRDRVSLHQLTPLLVHAILFGSGYGARVADVLRRNAG